MIARVLRSPALHMIVIGAILFGLAPLWRSEAAPGRPRLEIPRHRIEQAEAEFQTRARP